MITYNFIYFNVKSNQRVEKLYNNYAIRKINKNDTIYIMIRIMIMIQNISLSFQSGGARAYKMCAVLGSRAG